MFAAALVLTVTLSTGAASSPTRVVGSGSASATKSVCGLGTGKKATGSPIKLGAIVTKQPGTDFTDIPNTAKAYFDCVNNNGGINLLNKGRGHTAASALIGARRIGKAITNHPGAALQGRTDDFLKMIGTGRIHHQQFADRRPARGVAAHQ